jgi:hypothetical protein
VHLQAGFTGTTCETNVDDCAAGPCLTAGPAPTASTTTPAPAPPASRRQLRDQRRRLHAQPCQNGGTCQDGVDDYTCDCEGDWGGKDCDQELTGCSPNPCQNGGTCTPGVGGAYTCDCPAGFGGPTCETALVSCDPNPCLNGGTCDMVAGLPVCSCPLGYSGDTCEVEVCTPNPCQNAGTCAPAAGGGFTCSCTGGGTGPTCETAPKCGDYTDVIYRLSGQFRVKTAIGTNNYDLGDNSTTPAFEDATNVTPFASGGTFTAGFARLRFENDDAGNPKAGTVSLVEWYFPLNYQQTAGATLNVDTDHSVACSPPACPTAAPATRPAPPTRRPSPGLHRQRAGDAQRHHPRLGRLRPRDHRGQRLGLRRRAGRHRAGLRGELDRLRPLRAVHRGHVQRRPGLQPRRLVPDLEPGAEAAGVRRDRIQDRGLHDAPPPAPNCTTGFAATVTSLSVTEATVIGTQCG